LVAHCITGALRSFAEPRLFGTIRDNLIESFSSRYRVFLVASLDCRVGTGSLLNRSEAKAPCVHDYTLEQLDTALAYVGADSFELVPTQRPPSSACNASAGMERHPSFWLQQSKTQRCFEAVERYEAATATCFDWVVRSRPDDVWKDKVPPASTLPPTWLTTGNAHGFLTKLQVWADNNYTAIDDHFLAAPRAMANVAFSALRAWSDCRPTEQYERTCPPQMLYYGGRLTPMLQSECLLGSYLREHQLRWRCDGRFSYQMRRVPDHTNPKNKYTKMLSIFSHIPGRWRETPFGTAKFEKDPVDAAARIARYERHEHAASTHRWGENLSDGADAERR
jgi:hypothetical protein